MLSIRVLHTSRRTRCTGRRSGRTAIVVAALRDVAGALQAHTQSPDSVIRLGGDEFLVVMSACGEEDVRHKAEELRQAVEAVTPADFGYAYDACFETTPARLDNLVDTADRRMYAEKRQNTRHNMEHT